MNIHSPETYLTQCRADLAAILSLGDEVLNNEFGLVNSPAHNDESRAEIVATCAIRAPREFAEVTLLLAAGDGDNARKALCDIFAAFKEIDPLLFVGAVDKDTLTMDWVRAGFAFPLARSNARRADVRTSRHAHYEFGHRYGDACSLDAPSLDGDMQAAVDGGPPAHADVAEARHRIAAQLKRARQATEPVPPS